MAGSIVGTRRTALASRKHTAILATVILAITVAGGHARRAGRLERPAAPEQQQVVRLYASVLVFEWASVFYVWRGIRRRGVGLGDLVGGRWQRPLDVVVDFGLAAALWTAWIGIQAALPSVNAARSLLPAGGAETFVWILVALSAGYCEEVVFRGYFQAQFQGFTGSIAAGIVLQSAIFGLGHLYEGAWTVAKATAYGLLLGAMAAWRRSLRPGIIAHAWSDLCGVVVFR